MWLRWEHNLKLHCCINLYNDRTFLAATLESIREVVDSIIVADGAYELYYKRYKEFTPDAQPYSTDGSLAILKHFKDAPPIHIIHPSTGQKTCWKNQTEKRTALIQAVPDGDWFLILDADEMMMGDVQEGMEKIYDSGCIVAQTPLYNPGTHLERLRKAWHPRVFKKTPGMHYKGTHWHLRDNANRIIEEKYPVYWTDVMAIVHFKPFRDQSRLIPHQNYMIDLATLGWLEPTDLGEALMTINKLAGGV